MVELDWTRGITDDLSADRLLEITRKVSSEVRLSGSEEEGRSVRYLEGLLREAGLETELLLHDAYISLPGPAALVVGDTPYQCITHSFSAASGPAGVGGVLVEVGEPAKIKPGQVQGKIVLVEGLATPGSVRMIDSAGARAQIYVNGDRTHEMIVSTVWGSPGVGDRDRYPKGAAVSITSEVGNKIRELMRSGPVSGLVHCEVDTRWRKTPILVGHLKPPTGEDFVLFSGHLDSWHLGAMDNAGANATMVEAARLLARHRKRLHRGLRVAFWSGHSHGRYSGSAWYADSHWKELREHCVAHVNIDSVGGRGASVLSEGIAMASTRPLGAAAIAQVAQTEFTGARVGRAGDQSFVALGIPSLWMSLSEQPPSNHPTARALSSTVGSPRSGGLGWWWHSIEDTVDKLDPDLLLRDAQIYVVALSELLGEPLLPLTAVAEADELMMRLKDLNQAANGRFDLSTTIAVASEAHTAAASLEEWRTSQTREVSHDNAQVFNHAVNELLRGLVGVLYSERGPYSQDPAAGVPPLPLLEPLRALAATQQDSDEARFMIVDLVRARNKVEDLVGRGTESALRALEKLR